MASESKCPVTGGSHPHTNRDWWPNQLDLRALHQHSAKSNPMGAAFDYAKEFNSLDLDAVIKDLHALMSDSQEKFVADFAAAWSKVMELDRFDLLPDRGTPGPHS